MAVRSSRLRWKSIICLCLALVLLMFVAHNFMNCDPLPQQQTPVIVTSTDATADYTPISKSKDDDGQGYLLTLYVRMYAGTLEWYSKYFLFSLELFWPRLLWKQYNSANGYNAKTKLLLVLDDESFLDHSIASFLNDSFPSSLREYFDLDIQFEDEPEIEVKDYFNYGHDRQQWSMFYADKYMNEKDEYVGFVDTDTIFQTVIFPSDLFMDSSHPIIMARSKQYEWEISNAIANNTIQWLKIPREPFRCMAYFPMIMHQKHLLLMRKQISLMHDNAQFNQILFELGRDPWSQFNVFCSYLWIYQRNQYQFVIERMGLFNSSMDYFKSDIKSATNTIGFNELYEQYGAQTSDHDLISFEPHIRVSNHAKYMAKDWKHQSKNAVLFGYCYAIQFKDVQNCNKFDNYEMSDDEKQEMFLTKHVNIPRNVNPYLYYFEYQYNFLMHPNVEASYQEHAEKLSQYASSNDHEWNTDSLNAFVNDDDSHQSRKLPPHHALEDRAIDPNVAKSAYIPCYVDPDCDNNDYEVIWYEAMTADPGDLSDWTVSDGAAITPKLGANAGSSSDCPTSSGEGDPCWALCDGYMYRESSTTGYNAVSLTYSIDPWAMISMDEYCEVSWSVDGSTWNTIGEKYRSDDEIIGETVTLDEGTGNVDNLYIRIDAQKDPSNCCYIADFVLSGKATVTTSNQDSSEDQTCSADATSGVCFGDAQSLSRNCLKTQFAVKEHASELLDHQDELCAICAMKVEIGDEICECLSGVMADVPNGLKAGVSIWVQQTLLDYCFASGDCSSIDDVTVVGEACECASLRCGDVDGTEVVASSIAYEYSITVAVWSGFMFCIMK
eukprot:593042_1